MKTKSLARKHGLLLLALCAAFLFIGGVSADAKEILPTNVTTASSGCTLVGVEGSYLSQAQEALNRINAIRKEACDEGVPDPRDSSKNLSSSDYREIKWSSDLEYIARIRAAEASLTVAHARPSNAAGDSLSAFEVKSPNNKQSCAEVLAWNYNRTMVSGIELWYGEKADWVNQKSGAVTGHYTSMIDPDNNYVAIAEFINENAPYPNTVSGEFSNKTGLDETKDVAKTDIIQTVEILNSKLSASLSLKTATLEAGATTTASIDFKANTYSTGSYKVTPLSVTYSSSNTSVATVSTDGTVTAKSAGTATITAKINDAISATATVTVENHTHTWNSGVVTKAATCTTAGVKTYTCSGCSETKTDPIAATGHSAVTKNAKAATCTTAGYTGDSVCSTCGTTLSTGKTIAATGKHSYDSGKVTKAATCTTTGTKTYTCSTCSGTKTESIKATGHSYDSGKVTKAATCTVDGTKTYTCNTCSGTKTETVVATGHSAVTKNAKEATCTTTGYTGDSVCSTCNTTLSKGETIAATGHSYGSGKITKEATCTVAGTITYTCRTCSETKTETIEATGHSYNSWSSRLATCTTDGYTTYTCGVCSTKKTETIPATGHSPVIKNAKEATCTEKGYTGDSVCSTCNRTLSKGETIAANGHSYDDGKVTKAATCTEDGTKLYTCLTCSETKTESIKALGHDYDDGKITKEATCTAAGTKIYTCRTCSATKSETIDALVHKAVTKNAKEATCTEKGYTGDSVCSTCGTTLSKGEEIAVKEHSYDNGKVTKEATCSETGTMTYTCTACKHTETKSIDKIAHTPVIKNQKDATCAEEGYTGDKVCEACGKVIQYGESIEKTDEHDWDSMLFISATCTEDGYQSRTCGICGETEEEVIDSYGHSWNKGKITKAPTYTTTGVKTYTCTRCGETKKTTIAKLAYPKVGTSYTVGGNVYKVTRAGAEVAFVKAKANVKSLTIPATIRVSGITYKVTAINANAVKNNKKLKSAVIGANVKKIANGAFSKCKALKTVTFKTTLLTKKTASKKAFKSVHKKITLKVPKKVKASYKKIFKGMKVK